MALYCSIEKLLLIVTILILTNKYWSWTVDPWWKPVSDKISVGIESFVCYHFQIASSHMDPKICSKIPIERFDILTFYINLFALVK